MPFSSFVRGPAAVLAYLRALLRGNPEHHLGHNPAGGWAIVALLLGCALLTASGWATYNEWGGDWLEELHGGLGSGLLALVGVHVIGVIVSSRLHHENPGARHVHGPQACRVDPGQRAGLGCWLWCWWQPLPGFGWSQWASAPVNAAQKAPVLIAPARPV